MTISSDPKIRTAAAADSGAGGASASADNKDVSQVAINVSASAGGAIRPEPLNLPTVSVLTQLAQFSELKQMITMRQLAEGLRDDIQAALNPARTHRPARRHKNKRRWDGIHGILDGTLFASARDGS
jgi:hypothetical protein